MREVFALKSNIAHSILGLLICALLALSIGCLSNDLVKSGSAERARLSYNRSKTPVSTTQEYRRKIKQVFKIIRRSTLDDFGVSLFDKIKNYDLETEWDQVDSILQKYYRQMDYNYNPDTPENEWLIEMNRRIDYCDTFFDYWWVNNDMRAYVVIQFGVDDLEYVRPYDTFCINPDGSTDSFRRCWECKLSYARLNIYIQLQGKMGLGYFTDVVVYQDAGWTGNSSPYKIDHTLEDARNFFQNRVIAREDSPYYEPLPETEKNLKLATNVFVQPVNQYNYEVWSLYALPLSQFSEDSNQNINFHIDQKVWRPGPSPEIYTQNQSRDYSISTHRDFKDACCFFAVKDLLPLGEWKLVSTPIEDGTPNKTIYSQDIALPPLMQSPELSSILFYLKNPGGDSAGDQVLIGDQYYTASPFRTYHRGDSLHALITWPDYKPGEAVAVWYLSPKKEWTYKKDFAIYSEKFWTAMRKFDFPVLEFMEESDIVLSADKLANTGLYQLNTALEEIPKGEYTLYFLLVEPRLKEPAKTAWINLKIK